MEPGEVAEIEGRLRARTGSDLRPAVRRCSWCDGSGVNDPAEDPHKEHPIEADMEKLLCEVKRLRDEGRR